VLPISAALAISHLAAIGPAFKVAGNHKVLSRQEFTDRYKMLRLSLSDEQASGYTRIKIKVHIGLCKKSTTGRHYET
jgi:hypothetical protein